MIATDLRCPECEAPLVLKQSRYGPFYGCSSWAVTRCRGSHGAHPDGSPLGVPANAATKLARIRAHDAFDRLWKNAPSKRRGKKRTRMYAALREFMALDGEACHIGRFDVEQCARVEQFVAARLAAREVPPRGSDPTPSEDSNNGQDHRN